MKRNILIELDQIYCVQITKTSLIEKKSILKEMDL